MLELTLSDQVSLRLFEESDAEEVHRLVDHNREYLGRWLAWVPGETVQSALEFIRMTRRQIADNNGMQTALIVDGQIAGAVGVLGIDWGDQKTSLGYWLGEEFAGRGAMTAAVRAYTVHAFSGWGLHRMELQAAVENTRSRRIAERLGFKQEGIRREAERIGDRRLDIVVYAALAGEWEASG